MQFLILILAFIDCEQSSFKVLFPKVLDLIKNLKTLNKSACTQLMLRPSRQTYKLIFRTYREDFDFCPGEGNAAGRAETFVVLDTAFFSCSTSRLDDGFCLGDFHDTVHR